MKSEIVDMGAGAYAVRRTRYFLGIFPKYDYLDLEAPRPNWRKRSDEYFERCETTSMEKAEKRNALYGCGLGTVTSVGGFSHHDITMLARASETNEGVKDCLLKAQELAILSK